MELPKNIGINKHVIELIKGKQLFYMPINTLNLVELETWKTYIKTYLKTGFIQLFKSPVGAAILFDKKFNSSLYL